MALQVNLEKAAQTLVLNLEKAGIKVPELEVGFALDVSGSFEDEHRSGITNDLMTRLVPWGLVFDPDKKLDCFTFSNGPRNVVDVGPIDSTNYIGFVKNKVIEKVQGWNGGTDYSYVLEKMLGHFGWLTGYEQREVPAKGFFGKLFGKTETETVAIQGDKRRSLIIMGTDGDNSDHDRTRQLLRDSQERGDGVYFLFLGISNQNSRFPFLESIGDEFDNTGFVAIRDLKAFVNADDDAINEMLIGDELLEWLKK